MDGLGEADCRALKYLDFELDKTEDDPVRPAKDCAALLYRAKDDEEG
jgi:hypothetical protein